MGPGNQAPRREPPPPTGSGPSGRSLSGGAPSKLSPRSPETWVLLEARCKKSGPDRDCGPLSAMSAPRELSPTWLGRGPRGPRPWLRCRRAHGASPSPLHSAGAHRGHLDAWPQSAASRKHSPVGRRLPQGGPQGGPAGARKGRSGQDGRMSYRCVPRTPLATPS